MEEIPCNLCGSLRLKEFQAGAKHLNLLPPLNVKQCLDCSLIFLSPRPDSVERKAIFEGKIPDKFLPYSNKPANYGNVTESRKDLFHNRLLIFKRNQIRKGVWPCKILDIGASSGTFMSEANLIGFEAYGVEPSTEGFNACKAKNLKIKQSGAETLPFPDNIFDIVHSNHVFEHLENPANAINEAYRVTKPGGIVFIEVPNQLDNIQFFRDRILKRIPIRSRNIRSIHHLFFFSKRTLRKLLEDAGYKDVKISSIYGKPRKGIGILGSWIMRLIGIFYLGGPIIRANGTK